MDENTLSRKRTFLSNGTIDNTGVKKYSEQLLKCFQKLYLKKFGKRISLEKADAELNFLARLIETLFSRKRNNNVEENDEK